jgi:hypothetical protein
MHQVIVGTKGGARLIIHALSKLDWMRTFQN